MKKKIMFFLIIFVLACIVYLYYQNTALQVSRYVVSDSSIPKEFNGYKIVQISDFHNTKSQKLTDDLVDEIKKQKPDIIVITGDLIDSRRTDVDAAADFIERIIDTAPVYYAAGNHEARTEEYAVLKEKLSELNVNILDNKSEQITIGDSSINLMGINDPSSKYGEGDGDDKIVTDAINGIEYNEKQYTILLSHRPELLDIYADEHINLVFAGHAHGGQIRIPFIGGVVAPNQGLFPEYTNGKFCQDDTVMIVSRGIGNSLFPFRVNNRPELVVTRLQSL